MDEVTTAVAPKAHRQRLADLNDTILPVFYAREALQLQLSTETDPVVIDSLKEKILTLRNQIVDTVITTMPDFLDAIVYSWNNSFSYDEAHSYVLENLLESVQRYTTTKKPFCRFTSFFWMYNKNLLRNKLKKTRAAKRDSRKTHSLDTLISSWGEDDDASRYDTFGVDENVFEAYSDRTVLKTLYDNGTDKQKQILDRLYVGHSQSDIAKELGVTGTNINTVIRKLRKDLEKIM
jgi:RNA polymerase sigma factor (sigma-70 family)